MTASIVPALPGFFVHHISREKKSGARMPVIAWHMHRHMNENRPDDPIVIVTPITIDGAVNQDYGIEDPSGCITCPFEAIYQTLAAFKAAFPEDEP